MGGDQLPIVAEFPIGEPHHEGVGVDEGLDGETVPGSSLDAMMMSAAAELLEIPAAQ